MEAKQLKQNGVLIGDWEEVQSLPLSTITKNTDDAEILDGLIVKGYETKFSDGKNANGAPRCGTKATPTIGVCA